MRKVYKCAIFILVLPILLSGCLMNPREHDRKPLNFPGTTWKTTDGSIKFEVDSEGGCFGSICDNGEIYPVAIVFGVELNRTVYVFNLEDYKDNELTQLELWRGYFKSDDRFEVIVEETTYFEEGQKFIFCRVEE